MIFLQPTNEQLMIKFFSLRTLRQFVYSLAALAALMLSTFVSATIVEFQTSQGNIQVNLLEMFIMLMPMESHFQELIITENIY